MKKVLMVVIILLGVISGCMGAGYMRYAYPVPPPSPAPPAAPAYPYYNYPYYWDFSWYWWPPVYYYFPSQPPSRRFNR